MLVPSFTSWPEVTGMRMLTPKVGWAKLQGQYSEENLLLTDDGGAHWKNITPDPFPNSGMGYPPTWFNTVPEAIEDVFFLDTRRGWVLFCCGQENGELPRYDLAMTTDSGTSWSIARVTIPKDVEMQGGMDSYSGAIAFADSLHGWMNLSAFAGHSALGSLLITSDGGRSWHLAQDGPPGGDGPFCLVTSKEGWQLTTPTWNDPDTTELSVTYDGARSWHQVSMPLPKQILGVAGQPPVDRYYDLPTFEDGKHGFLPVTYESQDVDGKSVIVLFETVDGGLTWMPVRNIKGLVKDHDVDIVDVVDSTLFVATGSRGERDAAAHATLSKDGPDGRTDVDISQYVVGQQGIYHSQLSFVTSKEGWMLSGGRLFSTVDGGATWKSLALATEGEMAAAIRRQRTADSMQLLTPQIGWVLSLREHLLNWTEDGGLTWTTIAPPSGLGVRWEILSAFFLDSKRGWALAHDFSNFAVYSTVDAGAHWSLTNVDVQDLDTTQGQWGSQLSGQISFADSLNGWMSVEVGAGSQKAEQIKILVTSDGGQTWADAPEDAGSTGTIRLVTPTEGWLRSPLGGALFVTHDGAHKWEKVVLAPPMEVYPATYATYDLPIFEDSKHGFLPVTYSGGLGVKAAAVLFATDDGGHTWKVDRILTNLNGMPVGNRVSSAMVGPSWITSNESNDGNPKVTMLAGGARVGSSSNAGRGYYGASQLSFVSSSSGWILLNNGLLLSTTDAGSTWKELYPPQNREPPRAKSVRLQGLPTGVIAMQLLGPDVGVATVEDRVDGVPNGRHLFRTESGGAEWKEISPPLGAGDQIISNFFFLDAKRGWIALLHQEPAAASSSEKAEYENSFELLSTTDAGNTWTRSRMQISELESQRDLIGAKAQISFVDPVHGWMNMNEFVVPNWMSSWDKTLTTADGGKTWTVGAVNPVVRAADVRFVTPMEAWMVSEPSPPKEPVSTVLQGAGRGKNFSVKIPVGIHYSNELYVTHDGAKSWQKGSFDPPKEVYSPDGASYPAPTSTCDTRQPNTVQMDYPPPSTIYDLPTFIDSEHGFLPVTYSAIATAKYSDGRYCSRSFYYRAVLFATADGGRTWNLDRRLFSGPPGRNCDPCTVLSSVKDSTWVLINHSSTDLPTFTTLATGAKVNIAQGTGQVVNFGDTDKSIFWNMTNHRYGLDLATPSSGWILWDGELLSTTNGGGTLTEITPESNRPLANGPAP
jgi:photosystem II stability/assembly factor-like uncharacterized protein